MNNRQILEKITSHLVEVTGLIQRLDIDLDNADPVPCISDQVSTAVVEYANVMATDHSTAMAMIAAEAGIDPSTIERWIEGSHTPRQGTLAKVNKVLARRGCARTTTSFVGSATS